MTIYYVIAECEFYKKNGTCKRAEGHEGMYYGCNELWCERKVVNEYNKLKEKEE